MKQMIKDTLILFVITLIAGVLLGYVNELTKEPIAEYEAEKKATACSEVFYEENEDGELVPAEEFVFEPLEEEQVSELNTAIADKLEGNIVIDEVYLAYVMSTGPEADGDTESRDSSASLEKTGDNFYGYVIGVTTKEGYNGEISLYVGITGEGQLKGVSLLSISETPGLGMNAEKVLLPQFRDVTADSFVVVKTGAQMPGEIDAISGATITSQAITGGVNAAYECFVILQEGGEAL